MTKSDSLDNITLDSDEIKDIERFENNYYNRKNNVLQNGGSNKLVKNIVRLSNCYLLSQNQNGGDNNNDGLTTQIKKRLDKKIAELIVYNYDLEGGLIVLPELASTVAAVTLSGLATEIIQVVNNPANKHDIHGAIIRVLERYFKDVPNVVFKALSGLQFRHPIDGNTTNPFQAWRLI
jgi:hypothetical protein